MMFLFAVIPLGAKDVLSLTAVLVLLKVFILMAMELSSQLAVTNL